MVNNCYSSSNSVLCRSWTR